MEISTIKQQLSIIEVLKHYQLSPDTNSRIHCPFHKDKTPSMQIYPKTNTAYCFSGNCSTHGKSLDVIDFVKLKDFAALSAVEAKHEALKKCKAMIQDNISMKAIKSSKVEVLQNLFAYFKNGLTCSPSAKSYLESRSLDYKKIEIGFNTGQFHHGNRKDESLIQQCLEHGLLLDKGLRSRTGDKAYQVFGKHCIVFALRNQNHEITSLYFRSSAPVPEALGAEPSRSSEALEGTVPKHYYLKDRNGLYPKYPNPTATKLILTESIIDAATFLQVPEIAQAYSILACYGTNGLNEEHIKAIKNLSQLSEIIFAFDNDEAGSAATAKYAKQLVCTLPHLHISTLSLPNKDVNETLQAHDESIFIQLLNDRKLIFSTGEATESTVNKDLSSKTISTLVRQSDSGGGLNTANPNNIIYQNDALSYMIKGFNANQLDSLKITLRINNQ
jgi:DNA primase